jgi:hypothetical protein
MFMYAIIRRSALPAGVTGERPLRAVPCPKRAHSGYDGIHAAERRRRKEDEEC